MSSYRITRQITSLGTAGYACTVMAIREDAAGKNEFGIRFCFDWAEAERVAHGLEAEIRGRVLARGDAVAGSAALTPAHT